MRHLARGLAFKVAQQHRVAVALVQLAQRFVKLWGDVFPDGFGFVGKQFVHGDGFLFAGAAALNGADGLGGNILCGAMQPAGQYPAICESSGILRERNKHALGDILGEVRIANHPQRGGINEIHVAAH